MNTTNVLHVYCRVSTESQVEFGYSLDAQKKAGAQCAKRLGMKPEYHLEKGKSAAKDDLSNRPVLQQLLDRCDEGEIKHIFITELDRLTRSPLTMYGIKKVFVDNDVMMHTPLQDINLHDEEQEFQSDLTALLSRRENTIRSKRSKRGLLEAVKKGKWIGAILPYGYKKNSKTGTLEIAPQELKVYQQMIQLCLEGNGTNTIAKILNEKSIPTRCKSALPNGTKVKNKYTGKIREVKNYEFVWRPGSIYSILTNPIYKGERQYKGQTIESPALIDKEVWERVQTQLTKNKNYSSNHKKIHFYLLKGLLRCGRCGRNLYGRIKTDERTYMCLSKRDKPCGLRSPNLDRLNKLVWEIVTDDKFQIECLKKELKSRNVAERKGELEEKIRNSAKEIVSLGKRRTNMIVLFEKEMITLDEFNERNKSLNTEKEVAEKELKSAQSELLILNKHLKQIKNITEDETVQKEINKWTDEKKREFLNRKVKNIVVMWDEIMQNHFISITFEAGFEISKAVITGSNGLRTKAVDHKELITKGIFDVFRKKFVTTQPLR